MSENNHIEQLQNIFIQLEHEARHAPSRESLSFIMANSTKKLLNYHQAILWRKTTLKRVRIETISGTGLINRDSPYLLWLQKICTLVARSKKAFEIHQINRNGFRKELADEWATWCPPYALWCPLISSDHHLMGGLFLTRETPWQEGELTIIKELLDAYSHAWYALQGQQIPDFYSKLKKYQSKKTLRYGALVFLAIMLFPIRQSVLAPAQIVAKDPNLISSPLEGVVEKIFVDPNQLVAKDERLFELDDTKFVNQYRVAQKSLDVAQEKYRKAGQDAFKHQESKSQLAVLAAEVEKNRAQMQYSKEMLDKLTVTSPSNGVVIFSGKSEWIGKPVVMGQKVMTVANPNEKEVDIWLPISDAIGLSEGGDVKLFLNIAPLSSIAANIRYVSYEASTRSDGTLAYLVRAKFPDNEQVPRIGLQGTAKLYGNRVVLVYYLLWRPMSALRRSIGI